MMQKLKAADKIEVLSIIDNVSDIGLKHNRWMRRFTRIGDNGEILDKTLIAEHGLSLLVKVTSGEEEYSIIFDAGFTKTAIGHNLEMMKINSDEVDTVVISHGHRDHTGGLETLFRYLGKPVEVITHPDAFLQRYAESYRGKVKYPLVFRREILEKYDVNLVENSKPLLTLNDFVLVTGYIPRKTSFEKVPQVLLVEKDGKLERDNINDDQSIVLNLKDKGLVVISGCAHSGIVNTVNYAKEITGEEKVYAVLGGFHLSGDTKISVIEQTIEGLKQFSPQVVIPMHCTGFRAQCLFAKEFKEKYQLNCVGSTVVL